MSEEFKLNIDEALEKDVNYQKGIDVYTQMNNEAFTVAEEITSTLIQSIVKKTEDGTKENTFTISTAILAAAKTLTNLVSYLYEKEEAYIGDIRKARELVVSRVFPALLNPKPCSTCANCKKGDFENCLNPQLEAQNTESKFLPMVSNMLLEYDIYSKVVYMYTHGMSEEKKSEE